MSESESTHENLDNIQTLSSEEINIAGKKLKIESLYQYLFSKKDSPDLLNDAKAISTFNLIYTFHSYPIKDKVKFINLSLDYDFCNIYHKFLLNKYENLSANLESKSENKENEIKLLIDSASMLIGLLRNFSNYSARFCKEFHRINGISTVFKYLNNSLIIERYLSLFESNNKKKSTEFFYLHKMVRGTIGCLVNLAKLVNDFKEKWKCENAVENLLLFSEKLKKDDESVMVSYIVLASVADEDEIEKFPDLKRVLPHVIKLIALIAEMLKKRENVYRIKIQLNENDENSAEICKIEVKNTVWHLVELLTALYNMAVSDTIKQTIYFENEMKQHLKTIILKGNDIEIEYSLKMLWQLCFDQKISDDLYNDKELYDTIEKFTKTDEKSKGVKENSNGIVWLIKKRLNETEFKGETVGEDKHIMISYNRDNRDLCLSIKDELEKEGHKIWIDVENISGSSLESMANAIENSKCVLMCMSEKYKQSSYCRAEAEYAFQLNKPIIPLVMQTNYVADGWLGIVLGSKIFVNFTKYTFEECIRRTKHEINNMTSSVKDKQIQIKKAVHQKELTSTHNNIIVKNNNVLEWNEQQVDDWIKENKFHSVVIKNISPCNGKVLNQLYSMLLEAPEFFYSSVSSNNSIPTKDIALFSMELKNLFKN